VALDAEAAGVEYVIVLFDRQTSRIAAFVDGNMVNGLSNGGNLGRGARPLGASGVARLAVLGSGLEACCTPAPSPAVRPLSEVVVFSPTATRRETFARDLGAELQLPCRAAGNAREAVEGSTSFVLRNHREIAVPAGTRLSVILRTMVDPSTASRALPAARQGNCNSAPRSRANVSRRVAVG